MLLIHYITYDEKSQQKAAARRVKVLKFAACTYYNQDRNFLEKEMAL